MKPVYTMEGIGEILHVYDDSVSITPKGLMGLMFKGLKGTKSIPFHSITAIQFREAGILNGYIQFTIPGGNENIHGLVEAHQDENTFSFTDNDNVHEIREYIESKIRAIHGGKSEPAGNKFIADLERLSSLRAQGALSSEEFERAKKKIFEAK